MKTAITLIIMDGYGLSQKNEGNAINAAATPNLDELWRKNPHCELEASGEAVGLPAGTMGNSEVGHTNIGAGRVVYQSLLRITNSVRDGSFFENPALNAAAEASDTAHIFVLLSDIGVHSDIHHVWALLELLKRKGVRQAWIHAFLDGRDATPGSGVDYVRETQAQCAHIGIGRIATLTGRFYAMDRDRRWERVQRAYDNLTAGTGHYREDPVSALQESYAAGVSDEFVEPILCDKAGLVHSGDSVFFMNFRPDRARELTRAFTDEDFDGFDRPGGRMPLQFVCLTQYDADIPNVSVAFPPENIGNTLGEFLSRLGRTQLRISETEKYAHVTFFLNGGSETQLAGEERILIPSPKEFPTYDLIPKMRANEICDAVCEKIGSGEYDLVVVNYANCDMVGHTCVWDAIVEAVQTVDHCVGRTVEATAQIGGISIITADHGNAEEVWNADGSRHTGHTCNPVPFIIRGADVKLHNGRLADIAPTILELMGLAPPTEMTGKSLIE